MSVAEKNRCTMPSVLDREVRDAERDAFGHRHFAGALKSLLEAESNAPPFSVGLLGSWGTGKSSIKELYLADLKADPGNGAGHRRSARLRTVTFNAWRYGGTDDIKRALLRHVFLALGGNEAVLRRELYQQVQQSTTTWKGWWQWTKEAVTQNLASAVLFIILLTFVLYITVAVTKDVGLTNQGGLTALLAIALAVAGFLAKYVVDIRLKSPTFFSPTTTVQFPSTSAEEYELLLLEQLRAFKSGKDGRSCERLIVFVDDLDRLSAAEMVAGLDAVRTFLELPSDALPSGLGVIFVISCDEDRVAEALARGRGRLGSSELPGSVFSRQDARRYLDRLFQFRLEIPRFPKRDMRGFALRKLREMPSLNEGLAANGVRAEDVIERLIHVGVQSPRNAVQLLNAFAQSWWIASQRERDGIGSDQPGMLHEKAVTEHLLSLAAICVLRVDFPDFFGRLQERPQLIDEFSDVVFGTTAPSELPSSAKEVLSGFLRADKDGELKKEVQKEHRQLRQYLASLQGLRLPKRLQPLLLLSEDAVTRRYGPRAAELHEAFVSGDTQGVLEVFGRNLDSKPLTVTDVQLLEDLSEAVAQESEARRISAARVLADLAERVPEDVARGIMTPLARQMIDLKRVRTSVGPKAAASIRRHCGDHDQREIAARYCEDLLQDGPVEYLLPTGESPNLDELRQIVLDGCELVLAVRAEHGLPNGADSTLIEWLKQRHIRHEEESTTLPFAVLDRWVATYEDALLKALGEHYSDIAIAEFEAESPDPEDLSDVLRRIRLIHEGLAAEGEESRESLWSQLARLVAVRSGEAVAAAWKTAARYGDLRSPRQGTFLTAMAARLSKELRDDKLWSLDWEAGAKNLLDLTGQWVSRLSEKEINSITALAKAWAGINETAGFAERCFKILESEHAEATNSLLDLWSDVPFGSEAIGWPVRRLVAEKTPHLSDAQRANVVKHLDAVITSDDVPEAAATEYTQFVEKVPRDAWALKPLRAHVDRFFGRIEAMFQDQHGYLTRLFPAGRALLGCGPEGRAATMLQQLFEQAAGTPPAYVLLHGLMQGSWPDANKNVGQYGPEQLFNRAAQFAEQHPTLDGIEDVLASMADLKRKGLVPDEKGAVLARTAVQLWPHRAVAVSKAVDAFAEHVTGENLGDLILRGQAVAAEVGDELATIIDRVRVHLAQDGNLAVSRRILKEPPINAADSPDWALATWLDSLGAEKVESVSAISVSADLNDSQRERAVRWALQHAAEMGFGLFLAVVPRVLADPAAKASRAAILESSTELTALASGSGERSKLARALVDILPSLAGEDQVMTARWIRELGGQAALESASKTLDDLGLSGLEVLVGEFPESKQLKKRLKSQRRAESAE